MELTENAKPERLTLKDLLSKLSESSKNTLREYLKTGIWNEKIEKILSTGFFISLGVASKNEGIDGVGLSQELRNTVLAQLN